MTGRRGQRRLLLVSLLAAAIGACAGPASVATFPPAGTTPQPAGDATSAAKGQVIAALAAAGLLAAETDRPYRPPEGPLLSAAPRDVLQVALTDDPDHGYIVVYALPSPTLAAAAAHDQAAYLASGTGGASLFPPGTEVVLRVIGSNVVFFHWRPGDRADQQTDGIAAALQGIGTAVDVPS